MYQYYLLLWLMTVSIEVSLQTTFTSFSTLHENFKNAQILFSEFAYVVAGKLEKGAVLKAICSGFQETTEPAVCLSDGEF